MADGVRAEGKAIVKGFPMTTATANTEFVSVERRGAVAIIRYANPPHGYIAVKGAAQITAHLTELLADDAVRGIVLTGGQPGVFIRHADVSQIGRAADALTSGQIEPSAFIGGVFPNLGYQLDAANKPVIAALDGVCMGGGFEIALCCTMRVASSKATSIGLPEIRINIFPASGGTQRLQRILGPHRARVFMLKGMVVDAAKALDLGLIDELVPSALDRAIELAEGFAKRPAGALAAIIDLTRDSAEPRFDDELITFAELLRDEPAIKSRVRQFVDNGERLDEID